MKTSFTTAIRVADRRPARYVISARIANDPQSDASTGTPTWAIATWIPNTWSAVYGSIETSPVTVTASASQRLPNRSRTKSAAVT